MEIIFDSVILFVLTFILVHFLYYLFSIRNFKKNSTKKIPLEVQYLINKYKIDIKKLDFKQFSEGVTLIVAFDVSLVVSIVSFIENTALQMIIGFILLIPIIMFSFNLLGNHYLKKGITKNENK